MEINKCMGCMSEYQGYPCPNCGYDPQSQLVIPFQLPFETILAGKYLVGRVLGQGGFGITYIGWDIALGRKVAIKEYYPSGQVSRLPSSRSLVWSTSEQARSAQVDGMQMFLREARKMVKLDSIPNVVRVLDLFQENETAYIVMEFVEGQTLKSFLQKNGPMSWEQAKKIFLPAIKAMEQVHMAGLIHRDLSPDNLMLTRDGDVKILDLGAAKDLSINSGASSMQVAKGGFSPFEQYTQRGDSGTWTDVYAMSATIYYTLTGTALPVAMDRIMDDPLRWDHPNLLAMPASALNALKKGLAVQMQNRTQTMEELELQLFGTAPDKPGQPVSVLPSPRKMLLISAAAALIPSLFIYVLTIISESHPMAISNIFAILVICASVSVPWFVSYCDASRRIPDFHGFLVLLGGFITLICTILTDSLFLLVAFLCLIAVIAIVLSRKILHWKKLPVIVLLITSLFFDFIFMICIFSLLPEDGLEPLIQLGVFALLSLSVTSSCAVALFRRKQA